MTSLDIINFALSRLGAQNATSLSDTGRNATVAIQAYPFARDEVLRYHPWPCLMAQAYAIDDTDMKWVTATAYEAGDWVVNASRLYECITAGTSASAPTTKSDDITDGSVHWKYLAPYTDLVWRASTAYAEDARVVNSGRLYICITAGTSASSGGPTTTSTDITDGGAHWKFLAEYDNLTDYEYQYVLPADCLRIIEVGDAEEYLRRGYFIFTDAEYPIIRYLKVSTDVEEWDNFIHEAIGLRLASMIAENISGGKIRSDALMQEYYTALRAAMDVASGEASQEPEAETRWEEV